MSGLPRFVFCISSDSFLLQQQIERLSLQFSPDGRATHHIFWGDDGLDETFHEHLTLQGLFAQPKIIIVRNTQMLAAATLKNLSSAVNRIPQDVFIILCLEVAVERGKPKIPAHITKLPCYIFAEKSQWIVTVAGLTKTTLPNYILTQAKTLGIELSQGMLTYMLEVLPLDAATVMSELRKIALLADENGLVAESAKAAIEHTLEGDIFRLLSAIQSSRQPAAVWRQLLEYNQSGETLIFAFLATLTREARSLWQLCMGEPPALPPSIIPAKKALARSLGISGIAKLWELAADAEKGIKTGTRTPEQAFDFLVAELSLIFHPSR